MPTTCGTHSDDVDSLEPIQRHRGQLIDVPPVAGESGQRATAARQIAGLRGVVFGHIVKSDDQRRFFLEDIEAGDDELCFVGLFNERTNCPLGLVSEGDGWFPRRAVELESPTRRPFMLSTRTRK